MSVSDEMLPAVGGHPSTCDTGPGYDTGTLPEVVAYTDGACQGNPGPGGYGVVLMCGKGRKELSGGYRHTTNNRMELLAAITALEALKTKCAVVLHTDSQYVVRAINEGWAKRWRKGGWRISAKKAAKNPDLWSMLLDLLDRHAVSVRWVRGHDGVPENERADQLAVAAARAPGLQSDNGYVGNKAGGQGDLFATDLPPARSRPP